MFVRVAPPKHQNDRPDSNFPLGQNGPRGELTRGHGRLGRYVRRTGGPVTSGHID